jgi:5-methyltetrahydropteroyltriglutamate--homocysteine methyltransferase
MGPGFRRGSDKFLVPWCLGGSNFFELREDAVKLSTDRILTTHVGSLPRSAALSALLVKKDRGEEYDRATLDRTVRDETVAIVKRQVATGIDAVSDGETGKVGYSTYIHERLTGFSGANTAKPNLDMAPYPEFRRRLALMTGTPGLVRMFCTGAVTVKDRDAAKTDVANFRAAIDAAKPVDAFMTAASPGVVSSFQPNQFYPTHLAYIEAVGAAMQEEYETIASAGIVLQLDSPDLAMSRHTGFQDLSESEFLGRAAQQVEVLNHAVRNIPADRMRLHLCWGNYEGPHDHDIDVAKIFSIVMKAKPQAVSFEAANPRHAHEWAVWREHKAKIPQDKVLIPGAIDSCTNYVEHPELVAQRIGQFADIVGRERVIAGVDCGFGTFAGVGKIDPDIAFRKLGSLVEGAALASKRLWAR